MPEDVNDTLPDFSGDAVAVEDLPDFTEHATLESQPIVFQQRPPEQLREPVPTTPEEQQAINIALQRIDPRWNERVPEPTIGGLIGKGLEWFNKIKAPEEPMPAPLTPIVVPPSVEETPEQIERRKLKEHVFSVQHPVRSGVGKSAEKLVEAVATPGGIVGLAATPVAPQIMLPAWAAMGTEGTLESIRRIQKAREEGDRAGYYEAVGDLAVNAPMVAGPFLHGQAPKFSRSIRALREDIEVPSTVTEIRTEQPKQQEVPSAVQKSETGELLPNVRPPTVEGEQVLPTTPSPEGVRAGEQAQEVSKVPLTREDAEMQRVRALPEGPEGEAQLVAEDIAKAVADIDVSDVAGSSPVPALVRLIRRAARDPAMKTAAEQAMQKIGKAAKEQGVPLDTIKAQIAGELQAVYGADAPEMARYYFGEEQPRPVQIERARDPAALSAEEQAAARAEEAPAAQPVEVMPTGTAPALPEGLNQWRKVPSATAGGKPHFWVATTAQGRRWVQWDRVNRLWAVSDEQGLVMGNFKTEALAKQFAESAGPTAAQPAAPAPAPELAGQKESIVPPSELREEPSSKIQGREQPGGTAGREPASEGKQPSKIVDLAGFTSAIQRIGTATEAQRALMRDLPRRESGLDWRSLTDQQVNKVFDAETARLDAWRDYFKEIDKSGVKYPPHAKFLAEQAAAERSRIRDLLARLISSSDDHPDIPRAKSELIGRMAEFRGHLDELERTMPVEQLLRSSGSELREEPPAFGEGPGAKTAGAPKYPPIQQLTDQLNATPKVGTKQRLALGERIADAWSKKGDLWTKAVGRMANAGVTAKHWWEGIRKASDLDSRLGEYDYAIQYSSAASKRAGEAILRQMKDVTDREAAAILIDSARIASKDPNRLAVNPDALATPAEVRQVIKDALALLPSDTPKNVRAALERALDPSLELRAFSEQLKQYFGIREQDAVGADLFEEGLKDYYTHVWKKESNMPDSLRGAIATGRVNTYFQFARERKIPSLIEGILEGKKPILDPAKVVPFYNFAMDRAIASRTFIKALSELKASDGRPAVDVRGGSVIPDRTAADSPVLITPKTQAKEISDYLAINHPALQGWKWLTNTPEGRNVMMRGDMVVHPEFHETLSRFMEKSRLTAGRLMRGALAVGSTAKTFKLGLLPSTFHIVHVGTHAAFHWTNPFKWSPIDFESPATRFAIEKGHLKLAPSPAELSVFEEGITGPLLKKIPLYGRFISAFSDFMFHQYIPRLKLNTFENAMARARSPLSATGRGLRAGRLTENDLAARIGDASNSAFGELNQMFLGKAGRDPQLQRMLRLVFLAPDFGEARLRFASKFFSRYGDEERLAIATMLGTLYFGARLGNWLTHGNAEADDNRHMFEVKVKDSKGKYHWVGMRSVVGDLAHAVENPGQFTYVRLSPAYSRPVTDFLFGRDERTGAKLSFEKKFQRIAQAWQPIGLGGLNERDRTLLESLGTSMGFANRRDMRVNDVARKAHEWREKQGLMPIVEIIPTDEPSYLKLRTALNIGKYKDARKILDDLLKTRTTSQVEKAMTQYLEHPYTGSQDLEKAWASTFTKKDAELYLQAQKEKEDTLLDFYKLIGGSLK